MKYKFEKDLEQNLMSIDVVDARRFAHAIRSSREYLDYTVQCWEVVDGCLHAVVGFIRGDCENHY